MAQDITRICTTLPNSGKPSIPCEPCPLYLIPYTFYFTLFPIPYPSLEIRTGNGESITAMPLKRNIINQSPHLLTLRQSDFSRYLVVNATEHS